MLPKNVLTAIAFVTAAALGGALISQHVFDLQPCPWCIMQRVIYLLILVASLLGMIARFLNRPALGVVLILSLTGAGIAIYQTQVASKSLSCDMTVADQIITGLGLDVIAPWFFGVYASCFDAAVKILGIEYAAWSLLLFCALAIASALTLWISSRSQRNRG